MWQGINNITAFKGNKPATVNIAASLPDELKTFYARFEADNTVHTESAPAAAAEEVSPLSLSVLQTGEHPKSHGSKWHSKPCAPSMCIPTSRGFYRNFQSVPLPLRGYIYIYAFSRRFYPKRLTVHSGYTYFFVSTCVHLESNPQPLRC